MKKTKFVKNMPHFIAILLNVFLLVLVITLMNYVQYLLNSDVKINLTEIVTQNKNVITSRIKLEVNNLSMMSNQIADYLNKETEINNEKIQNAFFRYCDETNVEIDDKKFFVAGKDGNAIFSRDTNVDISGRSYFKLALSGINNISDRTISRVNGEEIFIISVPLNYKGQVIGTVQKIYTPEEMYDICSISLFSSQGYTYIINSQGYILISSAIKQYSQESDNYFRMLYAQGNSEESKQLENDIKNNKSGFMENTINGQKTFSAYTDIEEIHDWYLISSVATNAVSPNANIVINMFYFILSVIVFIFGFSMFYFLACKNKQQANLEHIAFVDSVTNGNTYNKFVVDLKAVLQEDKEKQFYILKFDIDNFKYVNNFYGFDIGDKVLYEIYHTIHRKLSSEEMIARISDDHFVLLLKDISDDRLNEILKPIKNENGCRIYFSAGLYKIQNRTENINMMIEKARIASEAAKSGLQNKIVVYDEKFDEQIIYNEQLKQSIETALLNNEFIPFYQPKVDINTNKLVGAEALARWSKKDGTLIAPYRFIPLCEKTGMIVQLDMAIFEQVLKFINKNLNEGIECVPISVNFSRLHLTNNNFLNQIVQKIHLYQIPQNLIEIELTESVIFDNYNIISEFIVNLHNEGLLFSMDDFGSGYSSLNMLKNVPIDVLKIDKEFLAETSDNNRRNIIFSTIAQMAERLNIKVVVEGVETIENVNLMKEFGCSIAQGYYYAKPMAEKDFDKIYKGEGIC